MKKNWYEKLLICPKCKGDLKDNIKALSCQKCDEQYPFIKSKTNQKIANFIKANS